MANDKHEDKLKFKPNEGVNWDTLVESPFGPIPIYGQYGGPGYTGGSTNPLEQSYTVKPIDPLDAAFRLHDMAYDPFITPDVDDRAAGDLALIQSILALDNDKVDAQASVYGGLATIFAVQQLIPAIGTPLLPQDLWDDAVKAIDGAVKEALGDIGQGLGDLKKKELADLEAWLEEFYGPAS